VVTKRINASGIHKLVDGNLILEEPEQIEEHILSFYRYLYVDTDYSSASHYYRKNLISSDIPKLVNEYEKSFSISCPLVMR